MKAVARLHLLQVLSWFVYLGGWLVLGGLARLLTAGPGAALGLLLLWLLLLAVFAHLQPIVVERLPGWLLRALPLAAAFAAAHGIVSALDGAGLWGLLLALPAWAWLTASAWTLARRDALAMRPPAAAQAGAACVGAALLWVCAGDIADLRASGTRLLWAALAVGLALACMPWRGCGAVLYGSPLRANGSPARAGGAPGSRPAGFPAIGCLGFDVGRPSWPLALASFAMLPMMCGLALWPELCGSDSLPAGQALGLHLGAMFAPALLLCAARIEPAPATPAACAALLIGSALAAHWLSAELPEWVLAWLPGVAWSLLWAASIRQEQKAPLRLAAAAEAP